MYANDNCNITSLILLLVDTGRLHDKRKDGQNLIAIILNIENAAKMNKRILTQLFLMNLQGCPVSIRLI